MFDGGGGGGGEVLRLRSALLKPFAISGRTFITCTLLHMQREKEGEARMSRGVKENYTTSHQEN